MLLLLLALALTMLSPLAFYTSRLPTAFNPIRKRALPRHDLFRDLRLSFVGIGALTNLLPCFFFFPEMRDFLGEITNQMSGVFGFFSFVLVGGFGILYGFCLGF